MNDGTAAPSAEELFLKWKQSFEAGTQTTADFLAADGPELIPRLRRLIDEYLSARGAEAASTLTGGPAAVESPRAPTIPGYAVEAFLGGGGMGEVWRVRDRLDRVWALKLVRPDRLSQAGRERFLAEGRAMDRLRHPHIVHIHHYDIHDDLPYFLMPAYPASLRDRLADFRADPRAAVRLLTQVAEGVGHLHAHGFVHRDLKPGNILIDETGRPAVSDFGLVKCLAEDGPPTDPAEPAAGSAETHPTGARRSKTVVGAVLGTRAYMSPEQAAGKTDQANPRWDVWSLGVMLHELLTGELPRSPAAPERLLDPTVPDNPPPALERPGLDPRLDRIVRKCLSRDPAGRYPDARAVAASLNAWLGRGRRWRLPVAAAAVCLVAALVTAAFVRHRDPPQKPVAPDPGAVLADVRQALGKGEPVILIGPTGMPRWFDVVVGAEHVKPFVSDVGQVFTIDSSDVILIDLPQVGHDRYRAAVEVAQQTSGSAGHFGLYAGRHRLPTRTGGQVDCFATLWFDDADGRDQGGRWTAGIRTFARNPGSAGVLGGDEIASGGYVPPPPASPGWHKLTVDVDLEGAVWTFDGRPAGRTPFRLADQALRRFNKIAALVPGVAPAFTPAGGYGLIVNGGSAAFRNSTVRPTGD